MKESPVKEVTLQESPVKEATLQESPVKEATLQKSPVKEAPAQEATKTLYIDQTHHEGTLSNSNGREIVSFSCCIVFSEHFTNLCFHILLYLLMLNLFFIALIP